MIKFSNFKIIAPLTNNNFNYHSLICNGIVKIYFNPQIVFIWRLKAHKYYFSIILEIDTIITKCISGEEG